MLSELGNGRIQLLILARECNEARPADVEQRCDLGDQGRPVRGQDDHGAIGPAPEPRQVAGAEDDQWRLTGGSDEQRGWADAVHFQRRHRLGGTGRRFRAPGGGVDHRTPVQMNRVIGAGQELPTVKAGGNGLSIDDDDLAAQMDADGGASEPGELHLAGLALLEQIARGQSDVLGNGLVLAVVRDQPAGHTQARGHPVEAHVEPIHRVTELRIVQGRRR